MEFALVIPAIVLVLLLCVEVAVVGRSALIALAATREGARVSATTVDTDASIDATLAALGPDLAGSLRVTVRRSVVVGEPTSVAVDGHVVALRWMGGVRVPLSFTSTMRTER